MEKPLIESIEKVFIDQSSVGTPLANRMYQFFPDDRIEVVQDRPYADSKGQLSASDYDRSKRQLFVTPFKGAFFKRCPGAKPGLACCNYFVLNLGLQCNMNCSYCYLQSYINTPVLTLYSNIQDAIAELTEMATQFPDRYYRVGTGETMDSLSMDDLTLFSHELIPFFSQFPKWTLEFKSKSAKVDQFLDIPHAGNVMASWSINPKTIVDHEEHGTASLDQRLEAARKCRDKGYKVTFHIDPMIWHPEWKDSYSELVDQVTESFLPEEVPYITVGALRFVQEQKWMMRERFGLDSWVNQAEVFPSETGKLRYDMHLRSQMFHFLVEKFKNKSSKWRLSLCMETPENWATTMASSPTRIEELKPLFEPPSRSRFTPLSTTSEKQI